MKRTLCLMIIFIFTFSLIFSLGGCASSKAGVIIYEAYTSGGYFSGEAYSPYQNSYVVLYNSSGKSVRLDGWTLLSCTSKNAEINSKSTAILSGTIQPGAFFVVQGGKAPDADTSKEIGEPLPFDIDLKADNFSPERKAGIIALCKKSKTGTLKPNNRIVVDYLAYDKNTSFFEGESPAADPSVNKILRRVSFEDTNDNRNDFDTKNIIKNPANIIYYTKEMTAASLTEAGKRVKTAVSLSHEAGYYSREFNLTLSTDMEDGAKIYYTLDGTEPVTPIGTVANTAIEYTGAIRIYDRTREPAVLMTLPGTCDPRLESDSRDFKWPPARNEDESETAYQQRLNTLYTSTYKANVVRAAAVSNGKTVTPTVTATYFVSGKSLESRYNMPVISIMADKDGLYNNDTGIFMPQNRENRGLEGQVPAIIQFFEKDGKPGFTENAKLQLNGGYTRIYPQKAFRINMSNNNFDYDLFDGKVKDTAGQTVTYFDRFVLRAGGNDWGWGGMRDPFWQSYCAQLGTFDTQAARPATVFLNGEYWGTYFITERQDDYYINSRYDIPRKDVTIVESFSALIEGKKGDEDELVDLRRFIIDNDMTVSNNYKRFTDLIDVDSYIDFFICEIFCCNTDWPHNNIKLWKNRNPEATEHTKWRMMMNDVDWAFHLNEDLDFLDELLNSSEHLNARMFSSLMKNSEFKTNFINRAEDLLDHFLKPDEIMKVYENLRSEVTPALVEHQARWNLGMSAWNEGYNYVSRIVPKRVDLMREALNKIK